MPRVVFMCGPAGSGKSTVARQLQAAGMTRLSYDQEAWNRGLRMMPLSEDTRDEIEAYLRRKLIQLLEQGRDVNRVDPPLTGSYISGTWSYHNPGTNMQCN